jgi:hypothetical protein
LKHRLEIFLDVLSQIADGRRYRLCQPASQIIQSRRIHEAHFLSSEAVATQDPHSDNARREGLRAKAMHSRPANRRKPLILRERHAGMEAALVESIVR